MHFCFCCRVVFCVSNFPLMLRFSGGGVCQEYFLAKTSGGVAGAKSSKHQDLFKSFSRVIYEGYTASAHLSSLRFPFPKSIDPETNLTPHPFYKDKFTNSIYYKVLRHRLLIHRLTPKIVLGIIHYVWYFYT
jgi:hypothetical protein